MAARRKPKPVIDIDQIVCIVTAKIDAAGGATIASLKLPKAAAPKVLDRLRTHELEVTARHVRLPLPRQLQNLLETGSFLPMKRLGALVVGASNPEAVKAAKSLCSDGLASIVFRGREEFLVPASAQAIARSDLPILARSLEAALKLVKKVSGPKSIATVLWADLTEELARLLEAPRAQPTSAEHLVARVQIVARESIDPRLGLAFVPTVVRSLAKESDKEAALRAVLEAAKRGLIELRPESGMGRLSAEEVDLCVPGPEGLVLSWIRLRTEGSQ